MRVKPDRPLKKSDKHTNCLRPFILANYSSSFPLGFNGIIVLPF